MHLLARRWLLVLLLLAATGSQTLALLHQVVHQPAAAGPHEQDVHERHGPLEALFALDDEGAACQLLDQLAHGAGPSAIALVLALALVPARLPWLRQATTARSVAPYDARGPPVLIR